MSDTPKYLLGRKPALIALLAATVVAATIVATPLVINYVVQRDEIEASLREIGRYRAEEELRPSLQAELRDLQQKGQSSSAFANGDTVPLAQAELQRLLKEIVTRNGAEIRSAQAGPSSATGNLDVITIQVEVSVPLSRLKPLLYAIETNRPYLFVDRADVAAPMAQTGNKDNPVLDVHLTLHGYRWRAK